LYIRIDQARTIIKNIEAEEAASLISSSHAPVDDGAWSLINSNIQSLQITPNPGDGDIIVEVVAQMLVTPGKQKGPLLAQLYLIIKNATDSKLIEHHKDLLKVIFDALSEVGKPTDKACCFYCLEEMCNRPALNQILAAFAELFLVRVTDVQTPQMPREVTKAAENCGMAVAGNFPPEIIARALCPIVHSKDFPVNQLAIKMLQRLCDSCELSKLRAVISDIITTLIAAYDHPDSAVRKAAVFAIVAVHCRLGVELEPYLSSLSGSKLKLLHLYIQRAQQGAS
jgi:CLIP-associating protein 1/2